MPGNLHIYRENDIIQMLCMDYIGTPGIAVAAPVLVAPGRFYEYNGATLTKVI